MYLNSSRRYFNFLLFFPFLLSRNLHFIHSWLLPLQTLSAALFYTYFLSFFHHDPFVSFASVVKAAIFSGAFSQEEADSCFFPLKCSEILFKTFSYWFSIRPFLCLFVSIFSVSVSLYLCLSLLCPWFLTDTPVWHFTLTVFITQFLMGTNWRHTTVFLCFRSCLYFLFPSPSREKLETSSTSKLTRLS